MHKNVAKENENIKVMYKINICGIILLEICLHKDIGWERSRIIMKKRFLACVLASVLCGMSLSGCGNGGTQSQEMASDKAVQGNAAEEDKSAEGTETSEDGVVTLRVWSEEASFPVLTKMIESFKEEYAGQAEFDIILELASDSNNKDALLNDVHNAADIFSLADDQLSAVVAGGAVCPVADPERISEANLEEAVEASSINGTLYAYPMTADNGFFMYYDKNYFSEADVQTLDGMLAVAEAAGKQITMDWTSGWYLYAFFGNTGLDFGINEDGVTNYCNWNSTEGPIKGTDIAEAMLAVSASPAFKNCTDGDFLAGVRDGSVIAGVSGAWNAMEIRELWGDDYGAVKMPTFTCAGQQIQMSSFTGYKMLAVNAYSEHKDWALKLADWFTNEENQTLRFVERNQGPSNKNAAASDEVKKVPAIRAVIEQSEFGKVQRVGNNYWSPCIDFGTIMAEGNPEQMDLQEIMDNLVAGITASVVQ